MKALAPAFIAATLLCVPAFAAAVESDFHIAPDGTVTATGITVHQKAKTNFFSRATWGNAFIRMVVITGTSTKVTKHHGEAAGVDDIQEKDVLDVVGTLNVGGDSIVINAIEIRDSALLNAPKTLSGTVKSLDTQDNSFVLTNKTFGTTTVRPRGDVQFTKGVRIIQLANIAAGDKVVSATGDYDYSSNTLVATSISIYQDKSIFAPRNFQGTLESIASTQLPTTAVVSVGNIDYTVTLPQDALILNNAKAKASLSRFVVGDMVRFYGAIRQSDLSQVDAEVLRDLNF